jgi:hypothetical protein
VKGENRKLPFPTLPKEIQDFLGYDSVIATEYAASVAFKEQEALKLAAEQQAQAALREARRQEIEKEAAKKAAAEQAMIKEALRVRPILEIESDLSGFAGEIVTIEGVIAIDSYFNYEYDELRDLCYSFRVTDKNYDSAHVYAPKNSEIGISLREDLLKFGGKKLGRVSLMINRGMISDSQTSVLADLKAYGLSE